METKFSHLSHGMGDHVIGHHVPNNLAQDGAPKRVTATAVHDGMTRRVGGQTIVAGGAEKSYLDSLSGATVGGAVKSAPGWGNAGAANGSPLARPPASKNLKPAAVSPGMRSRTSPHNQELGAAILAEALKNK